MTAAAPGAATVIDRMAVRWHAHGFTGVGSTIDVEPGERLVDPVRLDRLVDELLAGPLEDALAANATGRDELVCLRSVAVPPTTLWWDRPDADLVATWARTVAEAVAESVGRGSSIDGVVRYRSVDEAVVDLVVSVIGTDLRRAWAWRQVGLWPAGVPVEAVTAAEAADVAAAVLADRPRQIVAVFEVLARTGRLAEAVAQWGSDRVIALIDSAWVAHGGDPAVVAGGGTAVWSRDPDQSAVVARLMRSVVARAAAVVVGDAPGLVLAGRSNAGSPPGLIPSVASRTLLARALAAVVVLDAEPALVLRTSAAGAVVDALAERLLLAEAFSQPTAGAQASVPSGSSQSMGGPSAGIDQRDEVLRSDSPGLAVDAERGPEIGGATEPPGEPLPAGRTAWGGLLFLLHLVDDLGGDAGRADEAPAPPWPPSRRALHRLAHTLASRALPDVDPPRPDDPALLAFAGLGPAARPPEPTADDEPAAVALARADAVVVALRARLDGSKLGEAPEPALLAAVLRRSATITADPGWLDVVLDLDQISLAVRRAGLDLDPGWIPWLGRVVRFRYV